AVLSRGGDDSRRGDKLLSVALELRRQAERAALGLRDEEIPEQRLPAYSERVDRWLSKEIDDADQERRLGEDLLLATQPEDWKKAVEQLKKATDRFAAIQARALTLRQAFKLRDELLAALPYYSQWLGRVFLTEPQSRKNFVERGPLAPAENLWLNLNKLDALLQQPDPQKLDDLPALLKPIEDDWKSLKADFAKRCDREYEFVQASW